MIISCLRLSKYVERTNFFSAKSIDILVRGFLFVFRGIFIFNLFKESFVPCFSILTYSRADFNHIYKWNLRGENDSVR